MVVYSASESGVLEQARAYVRQELERDSSGHDWWHIVRVTEMAGRLAVLEKADPFICELAALLHDIADEKLNSSKEAGMNKVRVWLEGQAIDEAASEQVLEIIATMSYSGGNGTPMRTKEGRVVQDADRLDALGAIGIARTFAYSGAKGHSMHNPELPPREQMTTEQYRKEQGTAVNHFYEKLLKLKDLMNTEAARRVAEERHLVMEQFLKQFYKEWNADDADFIRND